MATKGAFKKVYDIWAFTMSLVVGRAFVLMLSLGILHNDWTPSVPALGFWACCVLSLTFTGLAVAFSGPVKR